MPKRETAESHSSALGIKILIVLLLGLSVYQMFFAPLSSIKKNAPAPKITLWRISDNQKKELSYKGHYTILHFWATWCTTCVRTLAHSSARAATFNAQGIRYTLICANQNNSMTRMREFLTRRGIPKKYWKFHYFDKTHRASVRYDLKVLPSFYIIDRQGKVAATVRGYASDARLKAILLKLQKKPVITPTSSPQKR